MRSKRRRLNSSLDKPPGSEARIISRAASNMCAPITNRSSPERAMIFSRIIRTISGGVSVMQTFLQQRIQPQRPRPALQIRRVVACRQQVLHVTQLQLRMRILGPLQLGDNQIFLARDERGEIQNRSEERRVG